MSVEQERKSAEDEWADLIIERDELKAALATTKERHSKICEAQRGSTRPIAAPLTNAAYDEACRDCAAAIMNEK